MGKVKPTEHIDHIEPVAKRQDLAFERSNLQGLCEHCHNSVKQREERLGHRIGVDVNGWPIDSSHHWKRGGG